MQQPRQAWAPLGRGSPHLPGDDQLRLAASAATDVSWGDLGDCSGDKMEVTSGAKANEDHGGGPAEVTHFRHAARCTHTCVFEIRNHVVMRPKAPLRGSDVTQRNCFWSLVSPPTRYRCYRLADHPLGSIPEAEGQRHKEGTAALTLGETFISHGAVHRGQRTQAVTA